MNKKKKVIGLSFSGGLDSTYLLWKNLELGNIVMCIYTNIKNNEVKTLAEKKSVKAIIKKFQEKYGYNQVQLIENSIEIGGHSCVIFNQVPIHLFSIQYSNINIEEFQIGYCMNDDAISYMNEIKKAWASYKPFFDNKQPKLTFPLSKVHKKIMLNELPHDVAELVFSCEMPRQVDTNDFQICGHCDPCKKYSNMGGYYDLANLFYKRGNTKSLLSLKSSDEELDGELEFSEDKNKVNG